MFSTEDTFESSEDILGIFRLLENELSLLANEKVNIDLRQLTDASSKSKLDFTYHTSTKLVIRLEAGFRHEFTASLRWCLTSPIRLCTILTTTVRHADFDTKCGPRRSSASRKDDFR